MGHGSQYERNILVNHIAILLFTQRTKLQLQGRTKEETRSGLCQTETGKYCVSNYEGVKTLCVAK